MANSRRSQRASAGESEETDGAAPGYLEEPAELSAEDKLAQFFGRHADDTRYSVYEVDPDERNKPAFLFSFPVAEAPEPDELLTQLLENVGPGEYEIAGRDPETGRYTLRQRFVVGSRRDRRQRQLVPSREARDESKPQQQTQQPAQAQSGLSPDVAALLEHQSRMFETLLERMASMSDGAQQQQRDPIEQLEQLARLQKILKPEQPPSETKSAISTLKEILEVKDLVGDSGGGSPITAAIDKLAPLLERGIDKLNAAGAVQNPARGSDAPNGEGNGMRAVFSELRTLAENETAPDQAAQRALEVLTQQQAWVEQAVLTMVLDDPEEAAGEVIRIDPTLAQHKSWLIAVAQKIAELVNQFESDAAAEQQQQTQANGTKHADATGPA